MNQPRWVLDGNYSRATHIKWNKAQVVVWLDYSFSRTLYRSVKRATRRALTQEELWPGTGNRETLRKSFFSKDSIILWSVSNFWRNRRRYEALATEKRYQHLQFVRLRTPAETAAYLREPMPIAQTDPTTRPAARS